MLIPINNYINDFDLNKVPVPDWTHLEVKSIGTIKLSWKDIQIDHESNASKVEAHTPEEIQALRLSFAEGVSTSEFPPAVIYRGKEYAKPWKLVYGYGRSEALRELQTKEWVFTHLEGNDDSIEDVQASENEGLPKRLNHEVDMRKFLINKVTSGKIDRTESAIRAKFRKVYPNRKKEVENRVVPQVMEELGVPQPYIIYTSTAKVDDWLDSHSKEDYCTGGEFDDKRDMFGVVMKEAYQYRAVLNAIDRYVETGKKTYVIYHCGAPTKTATLQKKREGVIAEFERIKNNLLTLGLKEWPIVIMGGLPQDKEKEDIKSLI